MGRWVCRVENDNVIMIKKEFIIMIMQNNSHSKKKHSRHALFGLSLSAQKSKIL